MSHGDSHDGHPGDGHVVVTGASGMLGAHLVRRLLDDGHRVHGVDLLPARHAHPALNHSQGDIRDTALLARVFAGAAAVVHTAAALPSYPADMIRSIIVDGTAAVLGAAHRVGVPRVVHVSSTAVYGLPRTVPTPETHPREPVDPYTRAKAEAEVIAERYRADGLCVPVLRPKTFLGPGRMGLFAMLFEWAEEGRHFPVLGRGDVRVQMFAVEDLVDALVTVLHAPDGVAGDTYNLGAAEFGTLREDFQAVLDAAGHGRRVVGLPAAPALAALRGLERSGLSPVYGRLLHKLRADSYVSIDKARERLGFTPRLSNRDAILGTFHWWRANRGAAPASGGGRTSREPWRQGALSLAKVFF
ncbi:Nucleoside-diphosphate-sugar epimerase [Micromonospora nigra]|uniref:Nucleoside-diphosphate-sugar epimerase n=1 Tax=Micromonospora nigra TaxID=145857 RepID=A0A1C6SWW5_9ACTN|nr:NAD-dependent epimerase/dehydratase family protein [Micromonospora nigra]SCL33615.1 Nucleoside-diphosphate-sugar epimerase [Micromonospora nigra]